jgi:hypothetical protein
MVSVNLLKQAAWNGLPAIFGGVTVCISAALSLPLFRTLQKVTS